MTDIVERLREYRMDVDSPDVVYEAADEIERLRAQLAAVDAASGEQIRAEAEKMEGRASWLC